MRFFRFLHRRTKSDPAIASIILNTNTLPRPRSLDAAQAALFAAAVPGCPQTFLFPTPADAHNAVFELQSANTELNTELALRISDCQHLRVQVDTLNADLFTQLHQITLLERQLQTERVATEEILDKLAKYERFIGLMINVGLHQRVLGDAHAALRAGVDPDAALVEAIKAAAAVPESPWSTIIPSVTGPRTQDEYRASLHMTLKTRRELRASKKIAKYWKQIALEHSPSGIITPSVSSISSIHEPLPPERQKAVDELVSSRRRASLMSQHVSVPPSSSRSSNSLNEAPAFHLAEQELEPGPQLTPVETPTKLRLEAPILCPLASESFKLQLADVSAGPKIFNKRSGSPNKPDRPVLGQLDLNVPFSQRIGYSRSKSNLKSGRLQRRNNAHVLDDESPCKARSRPRELAVPNVVPSFSKHSLCSTHLGPLGRIEEERDEVSRKGPEVIGAVDGSEDSDDDADAWSIVERPESSMQMTTPTKSSSRLPKPVLRQLNRLSLTKSPPAESVVAPLVIRKRSGTMSSPSPTPRPPLVTHNKRTSVWR
uniref:Shugoshin C-terminal domain-containing protein n=1 Tax=Mycena chlorophos TaxID=658473 RepID=A0ABQ0M2K0_MYCCL|nr:predicted protein [Mycena chlorophos]